MCEEHITKPEVDMYISNVHTFINNIKNTLISIIRIFHVNGGSAKTIENKCRDGGV